MKKYLPIFIVLGALLIGASYFFEVYNGLIKSQENVKSQWAQVENQYQRRFDLIPNLVESVKGMMGQEQKVFGDIATARTKYSGATTVSDKAKAAGEVESALGRLLVIMENYPALKSSENVTTLMSQLEGSENRVSVERGRYNDMVKEFNVKVKMFPTNIMANMLGFKEFTYFESVENAQTAPKVDFNN